MDGRVKIETVLKCGMLCSKF